MTKRLSILDVMAHKRAEPLVVLTAYTAPMARLLDAHVDIILVGDSLGMVVYGMHSTLNVSLDTMIAHGKAVVAASHKAHIVVDMPFGSYQVSKEQAFLSASRVLAETGCQSVKLEGGSEMADTIQFLIKRGIPVMGHIGLKPQHVHALGGYRYQGRSDKEAERIMQDALAVQEAGVYALVIEATQEDVARDITAKLHVPTIGIGASAACDGQVLVVDDMLGLSEHILRFVKRYADLPAIIEQAVKNYAGEVKSRAFPGDEHCFIGSKTS